MAGQKIKTMKSRLFITCMILTISSFVVAQETDQSIEWLSWEEAMERQEIEPKKIIVDVYTSWCGYCKKMDKNTFTDETVISSIQDGFYAVKFNAEQREDIEFSGNTFKFLQDAGRRGVHELAVALLDSRMGYPSFVYFDEEMARIMISPGYKEAPAMLKELRFAREEIYKTSSWKDYKNAN